MTGHSPLDVPVGAAMAIVPLVALVETARRKQTLHDLCGPDEAVL